MPHMTYKVGEKTKKGYPIIQISLETGSSKIVGYSTSKKKANDAVKLRLAVDHGWKPS